MRAALSIKQHHRKVVGIDLAGSPKRDTGICTLSKNNITLCTIVHTDQEIIDFLEKENPTLIAIDAPLNLPPGRRSMKDKNGEHFRPCDRELLRRGIRFFPITLGPMRLLTERGIRLKRFLSRRGNSVIEVYPGAAQDIWDIGRKQDGLSKLRKGLEKLGVNGLNRKMNGDELDAVTAALVGQLYLLGKTEVLGNFKQGAIVIPRIKEMELLCPWFAKRSNCPATIHPKKGRS
jgi:predicted nuclease with RNAse H fold